MSKISLQTEQFLDSCAFSLSPVNSQDPSKATQVFIQAFIRNSPEEASQIVQEIKNNVSYCSQLTDLHSNTINWIINQIRD